MYSNADTFLIHLDTFINLCISKGIMLGIISYIICKVAGKKAKEIPVVTWILAAIFVADLIFEACK